MLGEIVVLVLRLLLIGLIYLLIARVLMVMLRDLRQPERAGGAIPHPYGSLRVINAGATGLVPGYVHNGGMNITLGSSRTCSLYLDDPAVAPRHARIFWRDRVAWIVNMDRNAVTLLGINHPLNGEEQLTDGIHIHLGGNGPGNVELEWRGPGN